jgi:hypothetical protein
MQIDQNVLNVDYHVGQYTKIIAELRAQVDNLQQALAVEQARCVSWPLPIPIGYVWRREERCGTAGTMAVRA